MRTKPNVKDMKKSIRATLNRFGKNGEKEAADTVQNLIEETRACLTQEMANTGEWENLELNQAHALLNAGFPQLAVISVGKALAINSLSPEEYAFGAAIVQKQIHAISDMKIFSASTKGAAEDLESAETLSAGHLKKSQEETAKKLLKRQVRAASELEEKNRDDAYELLLMQEKALKTLQEGEEKLASHMQDLEQTLSWMAGGYSNQTISSDAVFDAVLHNIQNAQKETAQLLKKHQESTASELKKHQVHIAALLSTSEKTDATGLKEEQKKTAARLKEVQEIKTVKKDAAS